MNSFMSLFPSGTKKIFGIILLLGTMVELSACFQYPDGPVFTLTPRKFRLEGNWKISDVQDLNGKSILYNYTVDTLSVDTTDNTVTTDTIYPYRYQTMSVILSRDGPSSVFFYADGNPWSTATWDFTIRDDYWVLTFTRLEGHNDIEQKFYIVSRLANQDFNYTDDENRRWFWKKL